MTSDAHGHGQGSSLDVSVFAPAFTEPKPFSFHKDVTAGEAAKLAADSFGYQATSPTFQKGAIVLNRDANLVSQGVRDGDELQLVDSGGGV